MVEGDSDAVLNGLIDSFTCTLADFKYSTTVDFKLIPFQNNVTSGEDITELFARQNNFLHNTMETLVVDGGDCHQVIQN